MPWNTQQMLSDFDKVFAMLDGKASPAVGLLDIANRRFEDLRTGSRVQASYFDLRYYPGIGTLHFFARDKTLVDRLNRFVGARRGWLPPQGAAVSKEFWLQFEQAEKLDAKVRSEVQKARRSRWDDPFREILREDRNDSGGGSNVVADAIDKVLAAEGLLAALTHHAPQTQQPLLLEAA
jgi:hypothetical protein